MKCIVPNCKRTDGKIRRMNRPNLTSCRIPTNEETIKLWCDAIGRKDYVIPSNSMICSDHFSPKMFIQTDRWKRLHGKAVPKTIRDPTIKGKKFKRKKKVLPTTCIYMSCKKPSYKIYPLPIYRDVYRSRRKFLWMLTLNATERKTPEELIGFCSKHFKSGSPALYDDELNPDWVPREFIDHTLLESVEEKKRKIIEQIQLENNDQTELENIKIQSDQHKDPCSVINCLSSFSTKSVKYFRVPYIDTNESAAIQLIQKKRHEAWILTVPLKNPNENENLIKICSEHFVLGKPVDDLNYCHIDWVPTKNLLKDEPNGDPLHSANLNCSNDQNSDTIENQYKPFRENIGEWIFGKLKKTSTSSSHLEIEVIIDDLQDQNDYKIEHQDTTQSEYRNGENVNDIKSEHPKEEVSETKFKCGVCHEIYSKKTDHMNHISKSHLLIRTFICYVCDEELSMSAIDQMLHLKAHNQTLQYFICDSCGKSYLTKKDLIYHLIHTPHVDTISENLHLHTIPAKLMCDICGKIMSKGALSGHLDVHAGRLRHKCDLCPAKFRSTTNLQNHMSVHISENLECKLCGKIFRSFNALAFHVNKKHLPNVNDRVKCPKCVYTFKFQFMLDIHLTKHNKRSFECYFCHATFKKLYFLKKHIDSHEMLNDPPKNQKLFCKFCNRQFSFIDRFQLHINSHTAVRKYRCLMCRKSIYGSEIGEIEHKTAHDSLFKPNNYFKCFICNMLFSLNRDYLKHNSKEHPALKANIQQIPLANCEEVPVAGNGQLPLAGNVQTLRSRDIQNKIPDILPFPPDILMQQPKELTKSQEIIQNILKRKELSVVRITPNASSQGATIDQVQPFLAETENYTCDNCTKGFSSLKQLQYHKVSVHGKLYRCTVCNVVVNDLRDHSKLHKYCKICKAVFGTQSELDCHNIISH